MSWRRAPAGFVSGPRKLKIVRTASDRRTGMTWRVAPWWAGANMKPKPTSSRLRPTCSGVRSIRTPSASRTSAEPDRPVAERLPCLAIAHPAPAAMSAAVVETLNDGRPPPVPAVSTRSWRRVTTGTASSRIVRASPAISSSVSPFVRSPMSRPAICGSSASPAMITARTSEASSEVRSRPDATASSARVSTALTPEPSMHREFVAPRRTRQRMRSIRLSCRVALEEVAQHRGALRREDGLRVELDALGRQLAMADRHDDAAALGADLEAAGKRVAVDDERVVAPDRQLARQRREQRAPVVDDLGRLAVYRLVADHVAAERLGERLVPEAHTERRHARLGEAAHDLERDPGLVGRAGPRAHDDAVGLAREQVVHVRLVVAHDVQLRAQLAQHLHEVVGERVVVVDHE